MRMIDKMKIQEAAMIAAHFIEYVDSIQDATDQVIDLLAEDDIEDNALQIHQWLVRGVDRARSEEDKDGEKIIREGIRRLEQWAENLDDDGVVKTIDSIRVAQ